MRWALEAPILVGRGAENAKTWILKICGAVLILPVHLVFFFFSWGEERREEGGVRRIWWWHGIRPLWLIICYREVIKILCFKCFCIYYYYHTSALGFSCSLNSSDSASIFISVCNRCVNFLTVGLSSESTEEMAKLVWTWMLVLTLLFLKQCVETESSWC